MDNLRSLTDFVRFDEMVNPVTGTEFRTVQKKIIKNSLIDILFMLILLSLNRRLLLLIKQLKKSLNKIVQIASNYLLDVFS